MVIAGVGDKPPYVMHIKEGMGISLLGPEACLKIPVGSVIKDEDGFVGMVVPDPWLGTMVAIPYALSTIRYSWEELFAEPGLFHIAFLNEGGYK